MKVRFSHISPRAGLLGMGLFISLAILGVPSQRLLADEDKPLPPQTTFEQKVKALEEEFIKAREAALKELAEAEKKAKEAAATAEKALKDAGTDQKARAKAFEALRNARHELSQLNRARFSIQRARTFGSPLRKPPVREEDRLGVRLNAPSLTLADQLGLEKGKGLVISQVSKGSAGEKAGLKPNDVLVQVAGKPVSNNVLEFRKLLSEVKANTAVDLVIVRQGQQETIKGVTLPTSAPPTSK